LIEHLVEHLPRAFLMRELLGLDREMISGASSAGTSRRRAAVRARARLRAAQSAEENSVPRRDERSSTRLEGSDERSLHVIIDFRFRRAAFRSTRATKSR